MSYDKAIALKPDYANAYNNRGNALNALKRHDEAIASFDKAIALKPEFAEAHNNRANALYALKRLEEAIANYDKAITLKSNYAEAHNNRGAALNELKTLRGGDHELRQGDRTQARLRRGAQQSRGCAQLPERCEEAIASFDKAIALKPDCEFVLGSLIHTKMKICDWSNLGTQIAQFAHKIDCAEKVSEPFRLLAVTNSAALQRNSCRDFCAR